MKIAAPHTKLESIGTQPTQTLKNGYLVTPRKPSQLPTKQTLGPGQEKLQGNAWQLGKALPAKVPESQTSLEGVLIDEHWGNEKTPQRCLLLNGWLMF